ncbi:uncharacterized protein TEOVI_000192500 [Trypanosoma equiperdum]|uniref:Uncharacterized protein n=3 Tax=Trypanozoon TaxID=39700 RepID=Q389I8_TRYB2|nr:hypothetical protein, conserved [Trypanosoma brucei brucei TREU927]EAN78532.1 hypothetical protein, conserved [Trypanosoma brucei brucei TREU927]RHW69220.1 hypothetical protein DPX39_100121700 [Trypanosoma brucei equiperdum]SCU70352.1 hypothetical protein, conserved [Trypanosoma equiperdum]
MYLAVFQEFAHSKVLERIQSEDICRVDVAPMPCSSAKSEEELAVVRASAKLIIEDPEKENEEAVEAALATLGGLGFSITHRHPVTSAGCPMRDRVILTYTG